MKLLASAGLAFGVMIGLIICVILFKIANSDKKVMTSYDERQEAIRGKGYKYAFYTAMGLEVVDICLEIGEFQFPIGAHLVHFFIMLFSLMVLCIYCIWKGAYWGLNNNRKAYSVIIVVAVVLNVFPVAMAVLHGNFAAEGFDSLPVFNVMVLIWLAIIGASAVVKKLVDGKEDD